MPVTVPPAVDVLPDTPTRTIRSLFTAQMDLHLAAMPTFRLQLIALAANVYANALAAGESGTAALASQNAAASHAANAALSESAAGGSAAAAAAAAAALQAGLPTQASTDGLALVSVRGVAKWTSTMGRSMQIAFSAPSENEISNSSAANAAAWALGPNTNPLVQDQVNPAPGGLGSVLQTNTATANAYVGFNFTPVQGASKTFSVWWRGTVKPASGNLLYLPYRDAGNTLQAVTLPFSHASVIADGEWRKYAVTALHAGSNVTPLTAVVCADTGNNTQNWCDPQIEPGIAATTSVATGPLHALQINRAYDVSTLNGAVTLFLPAAALFPPADSWVSVKDYGRAAQTNNININRNGGAIDNAVQNVEIDIAGAALTFVANARKGWLIK